MPDTATTTPGTEFLVKFKDFIYNKAPKLTSFTALDEAQALLANELMPELTSALKIDPAGEDATDLLGILLGGFKNISKDMESDPLWLEDPGAGSKKFLEILELYLSDIRHILFDGSTPLPKRLEQIYKYPIPRHAAFQYRHSFMAVPPTATADYADVIIKTLLDHITNILTSYQVEQENVKFRPAVDPDKLFSLFQRCAKRVLEIIEEQAPGGKTSDEYSRFDALLYSTSKRLIPEKFESYAPENQDAIARLVMKFSARLASKDMNFEKLGEIALFLSDRPATDTDPGGINQFMPATEVAEKHVAETSAYAYQLVSELEDPLKILLTFSDTLPADQKRQFLQTLDDSFEKVLTIDTSAKLVPGLRDLRDAIQKANATTTEQKTASLLIEAAEGQPARYNLFGVKFDSPEQLKPMMEKIEGRISEVEDQINSTVKTLSVTANKIRGILNPEKMQTYPAEVLDALNTKLQEVNAALDLDNIDYVIGAMDDLANTEIHERVEIGDVAKPGPLPDYLEMFESVYKNVLEYLEQSKSLFAVGARGGLLRLISIMVSKWHEAEFFNKGFLQSLTVASKDFFSKQSSLNTVVRGMEYLIELLQPYAGGILKTEVARIGKDAFKKELRFTPMYTEQFEQLVEKLNLRKQPEHAVPIPEAKPILKGNLGGIDMSLEKEAKRSQLFAEHDKTGGLWNIQDGKIVRIDLDAKSTEDVVKQSMEEGGNWVFRVGDKVFYNTDFGYSPAEVTARLASMQYRVKNEIGQEFDIEEKDLINTPQSLF